MMLNWTDLGCMPNAFQSCKDSTNLEFIYEYIKVAFFHFNFIFFQHHFVENKGVFLTIPNGWKKQQYFQYFRNLLYLTFTWFFKEHTRAFDKVIYL